MNKVIWLTGQSGAGKTTLGKPLADCLNGILLDGDEMRRSISIGAGFSRNDRREHNLRVAYLAKELSAQMNVIVSVIAPMAQVRAEISMICNPMWVYVKRTLPEREGHFYEEPEAENLYNRLIIVNHDEMTPEESLRLLIPFLKDISNDYSYFIGRYQPLHEGHKKLIQKVLDEGKSVCVALRDTPIQKSDPYTTYERKQMFKKEFGDKIKIIVIPDVKEVCYGRKVGWGIREIRLDEKTEEISATKIRERI